MARRKAVLEVSEELTPFLVLREEGGVEHIGIREEDAGVFADILAVCEGGVTVVCLGGEGGKEGGMRGKGIYTPSPTPTHQHTHTPPPTPTPTPTPTYICVYNKNTRYVRKRKGG